MTDSIKFHIVIPFYNSQEFIGETIKSVKKQNYKNFVVTIIDDASTDRSKEVIKPLILNDKRFELISNKKNCGSLSNIVKALSVKETKPSQTIDVLVDGDDYLIEKDVLDILLFTYKRTQCLMTYGTFIRNSNKLSFGKKYPLRTIWKNEFRKFPWIASHLKTFRHDLFLKIKKEDLKDENGNYFSSAGDLALMFPMLEMASFRQECIPDCLYVYNDLNSICDHKIRREEQIKFDKQIRNKTLYRKLDFPLIKFP